MAIPKVSREAVAEACSLVASRKIFDMDAKQTHDFLVKYNAEMKTKQPELFAFLQRTDKFYTKEFGGKALGAHIPLFCSIVINALYIQNEIDKIDDIFKDFK